LQCINIDSGDRDAIVGFLKSMRGHYGAFRFQFEGMAFPGCRFDSGTWPASGGPGPHSLSVPIKILRRT
jgi:hypothetical protein